MPPNPYTPSGTGSDSTVVLASNDPSTPEIARLLRKEGYSVVVAGDREPGEKTSEGENPSLVILDLDRFENGDRLVQKVGFDHPSAHLIVLISSRGLATELDRVRARVFGATAVFVKPVVPSAVLDAVRRLLPGHPEASRPT